MNCPEAENSGAFFRHITAFVGCYIFNFGLYSNLRRVNFMKSVTIAARDGFLLSATDFAIDNPKAVVQIVHGAKEHKERYYPFMEYLNKCGFAAVVSDNRGHGESVNERYPLGFMDDFNLIVSDQYDVTKYIMQAYPDVPIYMLGHSLGSMIARVYLERHDDALTKLVLSGTANYISAGKIGIATANIMHKIKTGHGYSKLLERFANFLDDSWVVGDPDALQKYRSDPLCTYKYPIASMNEVFKINAELHKYDNYEVKNKDLPILSVSGELDPVTGGEKGIKDTVKTLNRLGYHNVTTIVYENMYHEVLNETERQRVYDDIAAFFETK